MSSRHALSPSISIDRLFIDVEINKRLKQRKKKGKPKDYANVQDIPMKSFVFHTYFNHREILEIQITSRERKNKGKNRNVSRWKMRYYVSMVVSEPFWSARKEREKYWKFWWVLKYVQVRSLNIKYCSYSRRFSLERASSRKTS